MKKRILLLWTLLLVFTGCHMDAPSTRIDAASLLRAPLLEQLPLQGVWEIDEIRQDEAADDTEAKYAVRDKLYIDPTFVAIADQVSDDPTFTSKSVNMKDYADLRLIRQDTGLSAEDDVQVFMIRDNEVFSMDLMKLNEEQIAFADEDRLYVLSRRNEVVPENTRKSYLELARQSKNDGENNHDRSHIAAMVGVRTPTRSTNGYPYSTYQTYFIADDPDQKRPVVYMTQQLCLLDDENNVRLLAYEPLDGDPNNQIMTGRYTYQSPKDDEGTTAHVLEDVLGREITFARGNYVSFVRPGLYPPKADIMPRYEMMRLDNLEREDALSVTDLGGEEERAAFLVQIQNQLEMIDPNGDVDADRFPVDEENIGIVRRNASWSFVTTMNWADGANTYPTRIYLDLVTKIQAFQVPTEQIGWTRITNKVPLAVAASIAPTGERVLIQSEDELLYYDATKEAIDETASLSIQLSKEAQIVSLQYFHDEQADEMLSTFIRLEQDHPQVIYSDVR